MLGLTASSRDRSDSLKSELYILTTATPELSAGNGSAPRYVPSPKNGFPPPRTPDIRSNGQNVREPIYHQLAYLEIPKFWTSCRPSGCAYVYTNSSSPYCHHGAHNIRYPRGHNNCPTLWRRRRHLSHCTLPTSQPPHHHPTGRVRFHPRLRGT